MAGSAASSAPETSITLYWGSGSPPAWRALLVLEEKGIPYHSERVIFESGMLKSRPFLALNPRGLVPTMVDGDVVLYESLAILHHVEESYDGVSLLPKDRAARATALVRMHEANNASVAAGEVVYYVRRTPLEARNVGYLAAKMAVLNKELALWNSYLEDDRPFLAGDELSLADISFFPNLAYMVRLGLDLSVFPYLFSYFTRMVSRESVQKTWPPHWKEVKATHCLSRDIFPEGADLEAAAEKFKKPEGSDKHDH